MRVCTYASARICTVCACVLPLPSSLFPLSLSLTEGIAVPTIRTCQSLSLHIYPQAHVNLDPGRSRDVRAHDEQQHGLLGPQWAGHAGALAFNPQTKHAQIKNL